MKEIDVVFRRERLPTVNELLYRHKVGFLFYDINGRARENLDEIPEIISKEAPYATGKKFTPDFVTGIKLEIMVSDSMAKPIVTSLLQL
jgi:nitrogen regulatory protein PII